MIDTYVKDTDEMLKITKKMIKISIVIYSTGFRDRSRTCGI